MRGALISPSAESVNSMATEPTEKSNEPASTNSQVRPSKWLVYLPIIISVLALASSVGTWYFTYHHLKKEAIRAKHTYFRDLLIKLSEAIEDSPEGHIYLKSSHVA